MNSTKDNITKTDEEVVGVGGDDVEEIEPDPLQRSQFFLGAPQVARLRDEETKRAEPKPTVTETSVEEEDNNDKPDPFLRYSNQNVRMWELLSISITLDDDDGDDGNLEDNSNWRELTRYQGRLHANDATRKTRLSTELHPDIFFVNEFGNGGNQNNEDQDLGGV